MNIRKTFDTIDRLRWMIDSHVWDTFRKYVKEFGIFFNYPESWLPSDDGKGIHFEGQDGCRGCYDSMALDIPYEFFEDYEKAASVKREEIRKEKEAKSKREQTEREQRERAQLAQLKYKYEGAEK